MAELTLDEKQDALRSIKFFAHCSARQIHDLADLAQQRDLSVGDELCHEGDFEQQVFVLLDGEVEVIQHDADIGTVGPGEVVGELAMLGDGYRTATLVARTPLRVLVMDPDFVDAVLAADPHAEQHLGPKARKPDAE
jgi:CRP/FNR family transcriptional regulator, cyclic AMP receptor protein